MTGVWNNADWTISTTTMQNRAKVECPTRSKEQSIHLREKNIDYFTIYIMIKQVRNAVVSRRRPNSKLEQKQTKEYLTTFLGQNNINNEFSTIKLVKMQIFSQNEQS